MTSHLSPTTTEMLSLTHLRRALQAFSESPHPFTKLRTLPHSDTPNHINPKTLYILDSSFNPPTRAHLRICTSALIHDNPTVRPKRLLLLLATQNADKAPKPASFEQRLAMMEILANDILHAVSDRPTSEAAQSLKAGEEIMVDIGVTKEARFIDKAQALEENYDFRLREGQGEGKEGVRRPMEQVHLTGFDTLIRLLDGKYYPPEHNLRPLEGLFERHRVRVTRRTDDKWGGKEIQEEYLNKLRDSYREDEGGKREWADRIELVDGRKEGEEIISSTKVREAAKARDEEALKRLVTNEVAKWILGERLYVDQD